jgi:hypothetical protein
MRTISIIFLVYFLTVICYAQEPRGLKAGDADKSSTLKEPLGDKKGIGKNFALFFATDKYDEWNELVNPINDARTIKKELETNFGFTVEMIEGPTYQQIFEKLNEYAEKKFEDNDQLLVFFAGHGDFEDKTKEGFIVAKDTKAPSKDKGRITYVSYPRLYQFVDNFPCRHTLLMMDACFSGTFDKRIAMASRGSDDEAMLSNPDFIQQTMQYKTRRYITSGGKVYVGDGKPGAHSPFARQFLAVLRTYGGKEKIINLSKIIVGIERLQPQPCIDEFGTNEPGSDFFFIPKLKKSSSYVSIKTDQADAEIYVDNTLVGKGNYSGEVTFGRHTLSVRKVGYQPWDKNAEIGEGANDFSATMARAMAILNVSVYPAEAEISIDGAIVGKGYYSSEVFRGQHRVTVGLTGYKHYDQYVSATDQTPPLTIRLDPIRAPFRLETNPDGATVEMDGNIIGSTPLLLSAVIYGKKKIVIRKTDYEAASLEIDIRDESPISRSIDLRPTPQLAARQVYDSKVFLNRLGFWSSAVLATGTGAAAYYFYNQSEDSYNKYMSVTNPNEHNSTWDKYLQDWTFYKIAIGGAATFVVAATYFLLFGPDYQEIMQDVSQQKYSFGIVPTTQGAVVLLTWRF